MALRFLIVFILLLFTPPGFSQVTGGIGSPGINGGEVITQPPGTNNNTIASTAFAQGVVANFLNTPNTWTAPQTFNGGLTCLAATANCTILNSYTAAVEVGSSAAASANSAAIASTLATINAAGGGILQLPCGDIYTSQTIDNKYPFVLVQGCGGPANALHDAGNNITYATRILPTFACGVGTPALYHRTPYASTSSRFSGGGFKWITVGGNSVCGLALEVNSIAYGTYIVSIVDMVGTQAVYVTAGVTGTDLAEAADPQHGYYQLSIRQIDGTTAQNSKGVVLDGSSNANTSFNTFDILIQYCNGTAFEAVEADNNFISIQATRAGGCTGTFVQMDGTTASKSGGSGNVFTHLSGGGGAVYAQGTSDSGVTAGTNNFIQAIDFGNGTAAPTAGTGSLWTYTDIFSNVSTNWSFYPLAVADGLVNTKTCRSAITTESLRICNGSANHIELADSTATNVWSINISGSNLTLVEVAGAGFFNTPNILTSTAFLKAPSGGGTFEITGQATASNPVLTLPTSSGTIPATASSPLAISVTTGNLTCSTCITTAGGQTIADLTVSGTTALNGSTLAFPNVPNAAGTAAMCFGGGGAVSFFGSCGVSDSRLKLDDPNFILDGEAVIRAMKVHGFRWRDVEQDSKQGEQLGLFAQEVEAVLPRVVRRAGSYDIKDADGSSMTISDALSVDYTKAWLPLVPAMQKTFDRLAALEAANDNLRAEIEALKTGIYR